MKQKQARKKKGHGTMKALTVITILIVAGVAAYYYVNQDEIEAINGFEECAAFGFPVLEMEPARCVTLAGKIFYEDPRKIDCSSYLDCAEGFYCRDNRCQRFVPEKSCEKDEDCLLIDQSLGFGCCWTGRCKEIDMSLEEWTAANKAWFEGSKNELCPMEEDCGPAPMCPTKVINDDYAAKCAEKTCVKQEKEYPLVEKDVKPKEAFSLRIEEVAKIEKTGISIKLLEVAEDSRCPKDTTCVWAGRVVASLGVTINNEYAAHNLSYREEVASELLDAGAYNLKMLGVEPYPEEGGYINKREYVIEFIATRKNPEGADYSCKEDKDCEVKDIGSLCGGYLKCVNKGYTPLPPELDIDVCGPAKVDGCTCINNRCVEVIGGKANIN